MYSKFIVKSDKSKCTAQLSNGEPIPNVQCVNKVYQKQSTVSNEVRKCTNKLAAPLSIITIAGDFNFPKTEWDWISISCSQAANLKDLTDSLLLRQYVMSPTRNQKIY